MKVSIWEDTYEGVTASQIYTRLAENDNYTEVTDDEGRLILPEVIRRAFERMGFDGIIDKSVDAKFPTMRGIQGATHYIVFRPEQIKSALGNRGTFDPGDADILAAIGPQDNVTPLRPGGMSPPVGQPAPVLNYIGTSLIADDSVTTTAEQLYQDYQGWANSQGMTALSPTAFGEAMRAAGLPPIQIAGKSRYLVGIRGAEPDEPGSKLGLLLRRAKQLFSKGGIPKAKVTEQTGWYLDDNSQWQFKMTEAAKAMIEGKSKTDTKK